MESTISEFLALHNFQRAWQKVAEKRGCAGIDRETIDEFARNQAMNIYQLRDAVANGNYEPQPCKQVIIPKRNGNLRELKIPTVRDRIVQQALLNVLAPLAEAKFSPASFAYRPNLSYLNAVEKIADFRDAGYTWVFDADIVKFFDNIEHPRLLQELRKYLDHPGILYLVKSWISVGVVTDEGLVISSKGIPQGAVISPILANIYLHEFDEYITATHLQLVRYADDFLVLARTQEEIIAAKTQIIDLLAGIGLMINTEKTQITNFDRGFCFLGHGFLENAIFPVDTNKPKLKPETEQKRSKNCTSKGKKKLPELNNISNHQEQQRNIAFLHQPFLAEIEINKEDSEEDIEENSLNNDAENNPLQKNIWNQEMAAIYLIEQGTSIYKDHLRFIIHVSEKPKLEIPIREVEQIMIFGNIQLSTPVINTCLQEKIAVLFLNQSGQYHGHLASEESTNLDNHLAQIHRQEDDYFKFSVSKALVYGKLINSKQLLMRFNRKRKLAEVEKAIYGISQDIDALDLVDNLDSLRGYEGITAARYFPAFGKLITNPNFEFSLRNRQPPTDPINSLLSFGYTLLFNNVMGFIIAEGLTPYIGNFHYGEKQKPYLAFDLMEEFRSVIVDSLVLKIINNLIFKPQDFDFLASTGGVYLSQSSRRIFLQKFEARMNEETSHPDLQSQVTYRHAIQLQVRRYKRYLLSGVLYESFLRSA